MAAREKNVIALFFNFHYYYFMGNLFSFCTCLAQTIIVFSPLALLIMVASFVIFFLVCSLYRWWTRFTYSKWNFINCLNCISVRFAILISFASKTKFVTYLLKTKATLLHWNHSIFKLRPDVIHKKNWFFLQRMRISSTIEIALNGMFDDKPMKWFLSFSYI